jgi:hypothetical protein
VVRVNGERTALQHEVEVSNTCHASHQL